MTVSRAAGWWPTASPGWIPGTLLTLVLSACGPAPATPPAAEEAAPPVEWAYQGGLGPDHWGGLDPSFSACSEGVAQSPVDLSGAVEQDSSEVVFNYSATRIHLSNDGHTVLADCEPGNSIRIDKGTFDLVRFQFHRPSEHRVGGESFPLEIQFLHQDETGRVVMVAVLCREGKPNTAIDTFADGLPSRIGEQGYLGRAVPLQDLLPVARRAYRYDGSLTNPPCTEPVYWIVLAEPLEVSADQLRLFESALEPNNRPVQPLSGREIVLK